MNYLNLLNKIKTWFKRKYIFDIEFNNNVIKVINRLKDLTGMTDAEILRTALTLYYYCQKEKNSGNKIVFIKNGKVTQEIIL